MFYIEFEDFNTKIIIIIRIEMFSVIFVAGRRLYIIKNPSGNVLGKVSTCVGVCTSLFHRWVNEQGVQLLPDPKTKNSSTYFKSQSYFKRSLTHWLLAKRSIIKLLPKFLLKLNLRVTF